MLASDGANNEGIHKKMLGSNVEIYEAHRQVLKIDYTEYYTIFNDFGSNEEREKNLLLCVISFEKKYIIYYIYNIGECNLRLLVDCINENW